MSQVTGNLLRLARAVLASSSLAGPVAVRTAALLGRMALERQVADRLAATLPGTQDASMRAQLLCLRSVDERAGEDASHLHGALSRACHHHPYELGPSSDELAGLLDEVGRLTATAGAPPPVR